MCSSDLFMRNFLINSGRATAGFYVVLPNRKQLPRNVVAMLKIALPSVAVPMP